MLADGKVLLAGGIDSLSSAELITSPNDPV